MKYAQMTAALSMLAMVAGCSTPASQMNQSNSPQNAVTYEVYGMDCPGCHGGLEKNLEKIPGVLAASANWKKQRVTLSLEDAATVSTEQVTQAVEDSNFTLGEKIL